MLVLAAITFYWSKPLFNILRLIVTLRAQFSTIPRGGSGCKCTPDLHTVEPPHDKTKNGMCVQRRFRSAWASDCASLCAQWVAKDPSFLHAHGEDWSDWADAQADLGLRGAHTPLCWFCHEAAQLNLWMTGMLQKNFSATERKMKLFCSYHPVWTFII